MAMMMHTLIIALRDSLTPETWNKNTYFKAQPSGNICMCVHGAGQKLVNPSVRKALDIPRPSAHVANMQAIDTLGEIALPGRAARDARRE